MRKRTTLALAGVGLLVALSGGMTTLPAYATGGGHGGGHTPVTICHNGHTITVDDSSLKAHLHHGDTLGPCAPSTEEPTPEPSTPPVTETPEPEPTEEPSTPPTMPVVEPHVQDYVTCKGGAFVLDNTGSTSDVTYTVNGVEFPVPAGLAVHTDADGTLVQPVDGAYTVTAGDRTWTFPAAADCTPSAPPQPADEVHYGTWVDQHGETSCDVDTVATHRTVTVKPYVLVDGVWIVSTDESTWTVTDEESTRPKTAEEIKACESTTPPTEEPTTPPTGEPTTPAPSDGPTTAPTASPSPTAETTPPVASPKPSDTPTGHAVPVADDTSAGTDTLAYTGVDRTTAIATGIIALALMALGAAILVIRTRRRRAER